ncbi:cytochrome C oxidase Cbb3 [Parashewanella spongiae]|uniref:Cytochrome C oxidase Cbb3 n=1 Tax=Parashewanella spongiae TaxID=342950 RepID=A0A3A6ULK3_9GAMM|nr:FixH family protein [Parashewanella spongiae]MCL1077263.1 FixH family protein [Parashewanella spongiae]RJY18553.1 cytochrome C oxidase Cbb3 [Parashewanella spongiae]
MEKPEAWYKQFWPWFLIILPSIVIIASVITFKIALDNADSLVADDYYKKGKGINQDIHKIQKARSLGLQFSINVLDDEVLIKQHGGKPYNAALNVEFYHPTIQQKDFAALASADGNHTYHITLKEPLEGEWEIRVENFNKSWRLQKRFNLTSDVERWLN